MSAPLSGFVGLELPELNFSEFKLPEWNLPEIDFSNLFSTTAKAATSGTCGENLTWKLDDEGTLTISGTGDMEDYSSSSAPWYSNQASVKKVIIEDGVTSIEEDAFYRCSSLTTVTIGNGATSIGDFAFRYCSSLISVTIGDNVTSIGRGSFELCPLLHSIIIPDSVTSIGEYAFYDSTSLNVYYSGSEEEWNKIDIDKNNDCLLNANIRYLSNEECEHTVVSNAAPATCTEDGYIEIYCTLCGEIFNSEIFPAAGHIDNDENGYCDNCKKIMINIGPCFPGIHITTGQCLLRTETCSICGTTYGVYGTHNWSEWVVEIKPTAEQSGLKKRICANCGTEETEEIISIIAPDNIVISGPHTVVVDPGNKIAVAIPGTTVADLLAASNGTAVTDKDSNTMSAETVLGTGMQLVLLDDTTVVDRRTIAVPGDLNGDGFILSNDARTALRASVGLDSPDNAQSIAADVNGNGVISSADARSILRGSVGLDDPSDWFANF